MGYKTNSPAVMLRQARSLRFLGDDGGVEISSASRELRDDIFWRKVLGGIRVDVALWSLCTGAWVLKVGSAI
jgi:hypothetical protein